MALLTGLKGWTKRFLADESGAAGIEFLATLPLLIGVMVFTAEYGRALRARILLDGAVQDATRYLARSPVKLNNAGTNIEFYDDTLNTARSLIESRLAASLDFFGYNSTAVDSANFRTDYYVIEVRADLDVRLPMLDFINWFDNDLSNDAVDAPNKTVATGITMTALQQARWVGDIPPGTDECAFSAKYLGQCP